MEHETKLSVYTRSLRQTAVMPRFFIGQEVKTEHGIGIIVAIEMPHNGLYLQPERAQAVVKLLINMFFTLTMVIVKEWNM